MRMSNVLPYYLGYLTPLSVVVGYALGGAWSFQTLFWVYAIIPVIDVLVGRDRRGLPEHEALARSRALAYRVPLWLYPPLQGGLLVWALWTVANQPLSAVELTGLTISLGVANGVIGITVAHELMHRRGAFERGLAEALMTSVSYTHFLIEHVHGHHRGVATPGDPATARLGEGFYAFLPRCVAGSLASAWRIERARLARRGQRRASPRNRMLRYAAIQAVLYGVVALAFGAIGVAVFLAQAAVAAFLLEAINYIEHYGLERRALGDGRFEPVSARHSWDSDHRITNWFLFELARHADHHLNAGRPYPALRSNAESPQLPAGYAATFLLAMVPPLWRRVMDPRVAAWRATP
jgi:alkane 1-monooxygenase